MGCGSSTSKSFKSLSTRPEFQRWAKKFEALQIARSEVRKLYKTFAKADLDGGGTIDLLELLTVIDVERTPFTERIFQIFDDDNSGQIDFGEFVFSLWNYCTLSRVTLGMFAFDLYDRDSTGILEDYDLQQMLHDIYGKNAVTSHYAKQVIKDLEELHAGGPVDLPRFLEFSRTHHSLLFPAFQLQLSLKKALLGVAFWERHAERRVKISKDKYIKIKDLLALHVANKIEQLKEQVKGDGGHMVIESTGTKVDRRKKNSQIATTLQVDIQKALASGSEKGKGSNMAAAENGGLASPTGTSARKSIMDSSNASNKLNAMEKDLMAEGSERLSGRISSKQSVKNNGDASESSKENKDKGRRKSFGNSIVQPIETVMEEGSSRIQANNDLDSVLNTSTKNKPGAVNNGSSMLSSGPNTSLKQPQRKRGSAASFIISNTNNSINTNTSGQIENILSHVQALNQIGDEGHQKEHKHGYSIIEDNKFSQNQSNKRGRRGSL